MEFREANQELQACRGMARTSDPFIIACVRVFDICGAGIATCGAILVANYDKLAAEPMAQYSAISAAVIGGTALTMRAIDNAITHHNIREKMSTNALAAVCAQSTAPFWEPQPHGLFFLPGALRRITLGAYLRRTAVDPFPGKLVTLPKRTRPSLQQVFRFLSKKTPADTNEPS